MVALLREERERLVTAAGGFDRPAVRGGLKTLRRKLYPYQIEGVERAVRVRRLLLADDMGLGKTAQAIAVCHLLRRARKVARGLVIAPASLKPQWLREWQLFSDEPIEVVEGRSEERRRFYRRRREGFQFLSRCDSSRTMTSGFHAWIHSTSRIPLRARERPRSDVP